MEEFFHEVNPLLPQSIASPQGWPRLFPAKTIPSQVAFGHQRANQEPRFGSGFTMAVRNKALVFFEQLATTFLVAYMAQDIMSMWLPRVGTSLIRDRVEYDYKKDPENRGLPPFKVLWKQAKKTVEGLNWANLLEESMREMCTGPGVLAVPTIGFAIARRTFGKKAVEIPQGDLRDLKEGFLTYIKGKTGFSHSMSADTYRENLKQFLKTRFSYSEEALHKPLEVTTVNAQGISKKEQTTLNRLLDNWSEALSRQAHQKMIQKTPSDWSDRFWKGLKELNPFKKKDKVAIAEAERIQKLAQQLEEGILYGNRHHGELFKATEIHEIDNVLVKLTGSGEAARRGIPELLDISHLWLDFSNIVFKEIKNPDLAKVSIPHIIQGAYERIIAKKFFLSAVLTSLGCMYLATLAWIVQSRNKEYPANRLKSDAALEREFRATQTPPNKALSSTFSKPSNTVGLSPFILKASQQTPYSFQPLAPWTPASSLQYGFNERRSA